MAEQFSTFDIEKKLGITRDRLNKWLILGYVTPDLQRADGHGSRNKFSRNDLYRIRLYQTLVELGFDRDQSASLMSLIFTNARSSLLSDFLRDYTAVVVDKYLPRPDEPGVRHREGFESYPIRRDEQLKDKGQFCRIIIDIDTIINWVDARI